MDRTDNQLRACVTALTDVVGTPMDPDDARQRIERQVVELITDRIAVDRAWQLPQGLDGDARSVLPLEQALGVA